MAGKFLSLDEAAKLIGVSTDALNELRDRREIYAYRDGGVWKFKSEDVERLIADRKAAGGEPLAPEFAEFDENLDSILLSEVELGGQSGASPSSTVIGKSNAPSSPESDIQLADSGKEGSDIKIEANPSHSDVRLASPSDLLKPGSDLSNKFDELDALDLDLTNPAGSGISLGSDAVRFSGHDDLSLDDQELALGEEPKTAKPGSGLGSGDSSIDLTESDDEIVLGGSGPGSDVTRSTSDSGISLIDPTDSGLSLEQAPLELGGSQVESLELGEDDMILLDESNDSEGATQLKADDEFLLTPLDEGGSEDLSDSGSQVIALDSDVEFDESAATMLGSRASVPQMLEEDLGGGFGDGLPGPGRGAAPGVGVAPGMMAAQVMEAPFSVWNIALLAICVLFLMITGMMMYDLMRNMWSWNTAYPVNSSLMDAILGWFEK